LSILPFGDPVAEELLAELPPDARYASMHVVARDGRIHSGGDGVIALMAVFPTTRVQAWLARILPPLRRRIHRRYDAMASRRGELSNRVTDEPLTIVPPGGTGGGADHRRPDTPTQP
jgi:predicted DCC family thiol-disulfide oxidoreductase YuxK